MNSPSISRIALITLRYRGILVATLIAVIVTLSLENSHRGIPVLIANRDLSAGTVITDADFTNVYLDGGDPRLYASAIDPSSAVTVTSALSTGQPLLVSNLNEFSIQTDQLIVQIPLEAGNPGSFARGSLVHVWALGDEIVTLVCSDARVIDTYSLNGSAWVTLSIARADETAVMQSGSVRLAVV